MNVKEILQDKKAKVAACATGAVAAVGAALPQAAFAEGEQATVAQTMGTLATSVQTDAMATITAVLPAIIGVVGIGVVVGIGIKWVRKMRAS